MKKFLVTADIHSHQYSQFSIPDPTYGNNRLKTIVQCLQQMEAYAMNNNISDIVIVGDLFHVRGIINATTFRVVYDELDKIHRNGSRIYIVAGNHDQANKKGTITSLTGLKKIAKVIEAPCVIDNCLFVPFQEHKENYLEAFSMINSNTQYLFVHAGVKGAQSSVSEYKPQEELLLEDVPYDKVDLVLLGHYHRSQTLCDNVFYVGSLCHNTFEDSGIQKGFWRVDEESVLFVPTEYPEFITKTITNKKDKFFTETQLINNYYWIKTTFDLRNPLDNHNVIITKIRTNEQVVPRITNIESMNSDETIKAFVEYKNPDLNHQSLIKYGQTVMKGLIS